MVSGTNNRQRPSGNAYRLILASALLGLMPFSLATAQSDTRYQIRIEDDDRLLNVEANLNLVSNDDYRLNRAGYLLFGSRSQPAGSTTSTDGIFLSNPAGNGVRRIAFLGQATPNLDGRIRAIRSQQVSDEGVVSLFTSLENTTEFGREAVYRVSSSGELQELIRTEKALGPNLPMPCSIESNRSHFERDGDLYIHLDVRNTNGSCVTAGEILRISAAGMISTAVSVNESITGTAATLNGFRSTTAGSSAVLTDGGNRIFFVGRDSRSNDSYWYRKDSNGLVRLIEANSSRSATATASGALFIVDIGREEIMMIPANSTAATVVFSAGQLLPRGDGRVLELDRVRISAQGEVLALASLTATPAANGDDRGLYLVDSQGVVEIAREGRAGTVAGSVFTSQFDDLTIQAGLVTFSSTYRFNDRNFDASYYYSRQRGLNELVSRATEVEGLAVEFWEPPTQFSDDGSSYFLARLADNTRRFIRFRLDANAPPPPPPSFNISPGITGTWFDPDQSGHGLTIEVIPGGRILAAWFTFDAFGNQAWFGGAGSYNGNSAVIEMNLPSGGVFIPNFDPDQIVRQPWGTARIQFDSCTAGSIEFDSILPGYGSGSMVLRRLSQISGLNCP